MKTIFLSDIHIGTDALTNLYKSETDQTNLKLILNYIQNNSSQIKDVVILGDWIDLWMFPSSTLPPTPQQIIDANPKVFNIQTDGSGDFISCMDSIQGNLFYVNGNHDMTVTEKDINDHFAPASKKSKHVHCINCSKRQKSYLSGLVYGEHGHWNSMVCSPYKNESLPFGYYMTRAGMQNIENTKKDLPPLNVLAVQELISYNELTFAQAMLTFQANQLGLNSMEDLVFMMPDGSTITANAVADKFKDLSINDAEFLRVDVGGSLNVSAVQHLSRSKHKILVLGHTHIKELYTANNKIYANSGFLCANTPDSNGVPVSTFVEIENNDDKYAVSMIKIDYATGAFSVDKTISL